MIMMNKIQIKELQEKIHDKALIMYQLIKFLKIDESQKKGLRETVSEMRELIMEIGE